MKKMIFSILIILLLGGCYDYVEIDDLAIISGMVIDYKDNEFIINSQIIENNSETQVRVFKTNGKTIEECLFKLSKVLNKDIFISHMKVLILTESTINSNKDYYDYFLRDAKSKMNYYVYYVSDEYKDKILDIYKDKTSSSLYIQDLMKVNNTIFSSSTPLSFMDFIYKKLNYGIDIIYPNLTIKKDNNEDIIYLNNLVAFNKDNNKIVLNDKESIYYNMLTNNLNKTIINIPCENDNFSLIINNSKTNYKWNKTFNFDISLSTKISSYSCKYDLNDKKSIDKLSKITNEYIKNNVNNIVNISVNNKIDFIGIGNYIYKHDYKYFDFKKNDWYDNLNKIKINIKINTKITSIGEMRK